MKYNTAITVRFYLLMIGMFLIISAMTIAIFNKELSLLYGEFNVFIVNICTGFLGWLLVVLAFKRGFLIDKED